jgi:hypothetical protein
MKQFIQCSFLSFFLASTIAGRTQNDVVRRGTVNKLEDYPRILRGKGHEKKRQRL